MKRRSFVKAGCACSMLPLVTGLALQPGLQDEKKKPAQQIIPEQVNEVLKFIDSTQTEPVKESVFGKLGTECFYCRKLDKWIESFKNVDEFIGWVNTGNNSRVWEKFEFNEDRTTLKMTGKIRSECSCVFADIAEPPKSLCSYCCKALQEEMFGKLIGKKVKVEVTESFLLGNERCSTLIHIL